MIWRTTLPNYQTSFLGVTTGDHTYFHNLGGVAGKYLVDMTLYDTTTYILHTNAYGGMDLGASSAGGGALEDDLVGAYWFDLNPSLIKIFKRANDTVVDYMRLRIWKFKRTITIDEITRHLLKQDLLVPPKLYEADANDDGIIDVADLVYFILTEP
jgi:hypothetical protein